MDGIALLFALQGIPSLYYGTEQGLDGTKDDQGRLTIVSGVSLDEHWQRLNLVRGPLLETYKKMSLDDYRRPRAFDAYDVTPEWVLHHLMQHEAEHRGCTH